MASSALGSRPDEFGKSALTRRIRAAPERWLALAKRVGNRDQRIVAAFARGREPSGLARSVKEVKLDFLDVAFDRCGARLLGDLVAEHPDVTTERSRANRIFGFAAANAPYSRRIADGETDHTDAEPLRHREVPGLVNQNQGGEDYNSSNNRCDHR